MIFFRFFALFCFLFYPAVALAGPPDDARFFSAMQDVPLVEGLTELTEQTVVFDKPEGRIVESVAEIVSVLPDSVKTVYEQTLPQLGWQRVADGAYARGDEYLSLNFETLEGRNFMHVMVRPRD